MKRFLALALVAVFFVSCASPTMRRWEGKRMTLCCAQHACPADKWQATVAAHCPGKAKVVGGETVEKVTGFRTDSTSNITVTPNGTVQQQRVQAETSSEECRIYECSAPISGF